MVLLSPYTPNGGLQLPQGAQLRPVAYSCVNDAACIIECLPVIGMLNSSTTQTMRNLYEENIALTSKVTELSAKLARVELHADEEGEDNLQRMQAAQAALEHAAQAAAAATAAVAAVSGRDRASKQPRTGPGPS